MKKKKIFTIIQIILLLILIFSLYKIYQWSLDNKKTQKQLDIIEEYVEEVEDEIEDVKIKVDFESLKTINSDTVGYLKLNNTKIEYPVVQTTNNDYYLYRSFDKSYTDAGWIFADYKNNIDGNDKNLVIYGHDRYDDSLFGSLDYTLSSDWYTNKDNQIITFITEDSYYLYEIFSIYTVKNEEYYIKTDFYNNEFSIFIETIKNRSIYDFGNTVNSEDKVLTLSTCYNDGYDRMVVHAKLIDNVIE